jgi:general stress protein YciG
MATNQNRQSDTRGQKNQGNRSNQEGQSERRSNSRSQQESQSNSGNSSNRGFAAMDDNKQREIASKGGKAVSHDRKHMADIGRKGGESRNNND